MNPHHTKTKTTRRLLPLALLVVTIGASTIVGSAAQGGDVYVRGYYRSDGTYVRPHIRSAPDGIISNNYGPSRSSSELLNPRSRDYDRDGTPNYLDLDSDNDGISDNFDKNPYGWQRR